MEKLFTCIWEFDVPAVAEAEFQRHYGPNGTWAALFRHDPAYVETLLLQDSSAQRRYLTIDRWQSAHAYRAFRERFDAEYEALDRQCGQLTTREVDLGSFSELDVGPSEWFKSSP
jgi:hypothetical protein